MTLPDLFEPPPLRRWPAHKLDDKKHCVQCDLTWIGKGEPTGPCRELRAYEVEEMLQAQRLRELRHG